jgi:hypothetical protein
MIFDKEAAYATATVPFAAGVGVEVPPVDEPHAASASSKISPVGSVESKYRRDRSCFIL